MRPTTILRRREIYTKKINNSTRNKKFNSVAANAASADVTDVATTTAGIAILHTHSLRVLFPYIKVQRNKNLFNSENVERV